MQLSPLGLVKECPLMWSSSLTKVSLKDSPKPGRSKSRGQNQAKCCDPADQPEGPPRPIPQNCWGDCRGDCRGKSGCWGECREYCWGSWPGQSPRHCWGDCRETALVLRSRQQRSPGSPPSSASGLPGTPPSTPIFPGSPPGSLPSSLPSSFGELGLGGPSVWSAGSQAKWKRSTLVLWRFKMPIVLQETSKKRDMLDPPKGTLLGPRNKDVAENRHA